MKGERLIMKEKVAELRENRLRLATDAADLIRELDQKVLPLAVVKLEEMDTENIKGLANSLHNVRVEYLQVCRDIKTIEEALG